MIQVFEITVYANLYQRASLSFETPYVSMNIDIIPDKLSESFSICTPVGESIIVERFYFNCPIYVNHKSEWMISLS